jgi:hypothetical protein
MKTFVSFKATIPSQQVNVDVSVSVEMTPDEYRELLYHQAESVNKLMPIVRDMLRSKGVVITDTDPDMP